MSLVGRSLKLKHSLLRFGDRVVPFANLFATANGLWHLNQALGSADALAGSAD